MPTVNLPGWGVDKTTGQHGVVALLGFEKLPVPTALLKELRGGN